MRVRRDRKGHVWAFLLAVSMATVFLVLFAIPFLPSGKSATTWDVYAQYPNFAPTPITIQVGDTVVWHNNDSSLSHTVTSDDGSFAELSLPAGSTNSRVFTIAGTYGYHCRPHPIMTGTVIVEGTEIPEFPGLALVVVGLLAAFVAVSRLPRNR